MLASLKFYKKSGSPFYGGGGGGGGDVRMSTK